MRRRARQYWLMKSEPSVYSFDDLWAEPGRTTFWDGVRNYRARNLMRDEMRVGDGVLFYHSNAKPPGVAGVARVASEARPDPTQLDPADPHFDPKASAEQPIWMGVLVKGVRRARRFVSLDELKQHTRLRQMMVTQRGARLSVQPVRAAEWKVVLGLLGLPDDLL